MFFPNNKFLAFYFFNGLFEETIFFIFESKFLNLGIYPLLSLYITFFFFLFIYPCIWYLPPFGIRVSFVVNLNQCDMSLSLDFSAEITFGSYNFSQSRMLLWDELLNILLLLIDIPITLTYHYPITFVIHLSRFYVLH